jgi:hypothetical protein
MHTRFAQSFEVENSIAIIDNGAKVGGQLIFTKNLPQVKPYTKENPSCLELFYNLDGNSSSEIEIFVGVFQLPYVYEDPKNQTEYLSKLVLNNTKFYMDHLTDFPVEVFDYQKFLSNWNVSYVICRDEEAIDRLIYDPMFSRVFVNSEVSIFKVNRNIS